MNAIEIKGFTKCYGKFTAVEDFHLSVPQGEIVGFVGKNGAGKSTIIRSMFQLIRPTTGEISILGLDSQRDSKKILGKVGYVPSEAVFYQGLTAADLLRFALQFTDGTWGEVEELAEYFQLDLSKKISSLSLGNRKKVSLIQCFLKNAELLVLDEPTGGLDPLMQHKFFQYLLCEKEKGKTIFLSSHNLAEVEQYCDRVAIIQSGKLMDYVDIRELSLQKTQIASYQVRNQGETTEIISDLNAFTAKIAGLDLVSLEVKTQSVTEQFAVYFTEEVVHEKHL